MTRIFTYPVTKSGTVLEYLKSLGYSQGLIVHLKKTEQGILKNGKWAYVRDMLSPGDVLTVSLTPKEEQREILPVDCSLDILYEDLDILVINKPAYMPIHPSQGHHENTLANGVMFHYKDQLPFVFRCINRLDKNTTGVVLVAKHALSASILSDMIRDRKIKRTYLAVVTGKTATLGQITAPIGRMDDSTIERTVRKDGDPASTHFQRLAYTDGYSLLSLILDTGRTHQIRVHMKHIGHPIPGDFLYNPEYSRIKRQALHSFSLSFLHPIKKEPLYFEAPLPCDMMQFKFENIPRR